MFVDIACIAVVMHCRDDIVTIYVVVTHGVGVAAICCICRVACVVVVFITAAYVVIFMLLISLLLLPLYLWRVPLLFVLSMLVFASILCVHNVTRTYHTILIPNQPMCNRTRQLPQHPLV